MSFGIQLPNGSQKLMVGVSDGTVAEAFVPAYSILDPTRDGFGRTRQSNPTTISDYQNQYDINPNYWSSGTTNGTITHLPNESSIALRVSAGTDTASVLRQTYTYHRYQPGKSQQILMTFVMAPAQTNLRQRAGYYDTNNGIFVERGADGIVYMVIRTFETGSVGENRVPQSQWNLDTMNGTGGNDNPSGILLNMDQSQIFAVDLEWLGVGTVRVGFVINKAVYYVHAFNNANLNDAVYMTTANLPVRYEIDVTGGTIATSAAMKQICSTVISEGGFEEGRGYRVSAGNGTTQVVATGRRPIFTVRPRQQFNGIQNRGQIVIDDVEIYALNNAVLVEVVWNPTLSTGTAFGTIAGQGAFSIAEVDVGASVLSGGITIHSTYVAPSGQAAGVRGVAERSITARLPLGLDYLGSNPQQLSIVVNPIGGAGTVFCMVNWQEVR